MERKTARILFLVSLYGIMIAAGIAVTVWYVITHPKTDDDDSDDSGSSVTPSVSPTPINYIELAITDSAGLCYSLEKLQLSWVQPKNCALVGVWFQDPVNNKLVYNFNDVVISCLKRPVQAGQAVVGASDLRGCENVTIVSNDTHRQIQSTSSVNQEILCLNASNGTWVSNCQDPGTLLNIKFSE